MAATSSPPPIISHVAEGEEDHNQSANISAISIPYTPTSSVLSRGSASISAAPSRRQSSSRTQHRKSQSTSNPVAVAAKEAVLPKRPLSLQLGKEEMRVEVAEAGDPDTMPHGVRVGKEDRQRLLSLTLPPSPPLTTNSELEAEPDTERGEQLPAEQEPSESAHTDLHASPVVERDITDTWPTNEVSAPNSSARPSRDLTRPRTISVLSSSASHPLAPSSPTHQGATAADIDLERGPDQSSSKRADVAVAKPFEVIRDPQRRIPNLKPPKSSYYLGPPTGPTAYGTPPVGRLGVHHPREIVRIERDYDNGELVQFSAAYPMELQGRITPTQFLETINAINEGLIHAHSITSAILHNVLAILTLWISPLVLQSKYEMEMEKLKLLVDVLNAEVYNPAGLNILWPRKNAFLFLEIEYY